MTDNHDTTTSILAEIAEYGPFLPGSVRKTTTKRIMKDGSVKVYETQPIYTYTDPVSGKQKSKRIPKDAFKRVRQLTKRHVGMKKLLARFEAASVAENLDDNSKKNSSRWASESTAQT